MNKELTTEYLKVLKENLLNENDCCILMEGNEEKEKAKKLEKDEKTSEKLELSILNCLINLEEVLPANFKYLDTRCKNEEFTGFLDFIYKIALCDFTDEPEKYFPSYEKQIFHILNRIYAMIKSSLTINRLAKIIDEGLLQVVKLRDILLNDKTNSKIYDILDNYVKQFEEIKIKTDVYEEEYPRDLPLTDLCMKDIRKNHNFLTVVKWGIIMIKYCNYVYDSIILANLCQTKEKTIIIAAGSDHTTLLENFLQEDNAQKFFSFKVDETEITPSKVNEYWKKY